MARAWEARNLERKVQGEMGYIDRKGMLALSFETLKLDVFLKKVIILARLLH